MKRCERCRGNLIQDIEIASVGELQATVLKCLLCATVYSDVPVGPRASRGWTIADDIEEFVKNPYERGSA